MVAGVKVREFDLAAYVPANANAIMGIVGPATKGPTNQLLSFSDEGNFINSIGRPVDRQYAVRAGIRYLRFGSRLNFVRIAGSLLQTAYIEQWQEVSGELIPLIRFDAVSPGTWANDTVKINIFHNGNPAVSYNVYIYFLDKPVEKYSNLTNSTIANVINGNSKYITVTLHQDAGVTFPTETRNSTTGILVPLVLAHGDDGCFASSRSTDSSAGGISAATVWEYTMTANTTKNYTNVEGRNIAPGSLEIKTATPAETFTDSLGILTGSAGGTGLVNYETGEWSVTFNGTPTADVTVEYRTATHEVVGSTENGEDDYEGTISRNGIRPEHIILYDPRYDQVDLGDGGTATYSKTLGANIVRGSLVITALNTLSTTMTAIDDGEGGFTGDVVAAGTINYVSGAVSLEFTSNVKNAAAVMATYDVYIGDDGNGALSGDSVVGTIDYETGEWTLEHTFTPAGDYEPGLLEGGSIDAFFSHATVFLGDGAEDTFSGTLNEFPIKAGSVEIYYAAGTDPLTDNGSGTISGVGGEGTIDYNTGEYKIVFIAPPADGFAVQIVTDAILLHVTCKYPGPIGNEREILSDGIYVWIDKATNTPISPESAQWYRVRVMFNDGTGTEAVETFDNLRTYTELVNTINDEENGSDYIYFEETGIIGEPNVAYDSYTGQKIGMSGAFSNDDVIGTQAEATFTGLQLFSNPDLVPVHFLSSPGQYHRQIQQAGLEFCENRKAMWIASGPNLDHIDKAKAFINGEYNAVTVGGDAVPTIDVPYPPLAALSSDQGIYAYSWLYYYDQYTDAEVWEPPEGDIMALIAKVDKNFAPWFPIAGLRRGQITNCSAIRYSPTEAERERTYGLYGDTVEVVNPIVEFAGEGIYLFGQRTMTRTTTAMDRIHARWTANLIAIELLRSGRNFSFELNDSILWREISASVESLLRPIKAQRGIQDYRVICDSTTNTPENIAQKRVVCKIFIQFAEAAEEIEFQMIYTPTTAEFSDVAPLG